MSETALKGNPVNIIGSMPAIGSEAPAFNLVKRDLSELSLEELSGKKVILNIFPSLDTGVCATSVRHFNKEAAGVENTVVLAISKDLPFAHERFCTTEGIENVIALSAFRNNLFGEEYGVIMANGPLKGLFARAVILIDESGKVAYSELVPEITQEPDYDTVMKAVNG